MFGDARWSMNRRVKNLERGVGRKQAGTDTPYQFSVSPTCPPSTAITIRGGMAVAGDYWVILNSSAVVPDNTCDFADSSDTGLACNFSSANYYIGAVVGYHSDYLADLGFGTYTGAKFKCAVGSSSLSLPTEYATAAEAEALVDLLLNGGSSATYFERLPLFGVILRNNGKTGVNGAVLPIDAVNRGRSYLYRDARPRNLMTA